MASLIKNTAYYTIGNFTSKAISFLLLPLYTSYLSPAEFGIVNSMQVFTNILLIFFTIGLERSIYRLFFDYKTEEERKNFLGTISISILIIAAFVCVILFLFNTQVVKIFKSIAFNPYFSYAILTAFFTSFSLVPTISLQVREKAKEYLIVSFLILIFNVLPVIWYVVYQKEGAVGMLKGAMIGNAASLLFILPITFKQINLNFKRQILIKTLKYCLPLVPMVISSWVLNMSDRIFIERYFSNYDVGIYSLGYKIGQLVQFLSVSILMAYNPMFYKLANSRNQIAAKMKLQKTNNIIVLFLLFIGFLVALFSKDVITLFFNKQYLITYKIIPTITLGYFFTQLISLQNMSFHQEKKTVVIMNISLIAAVINVGLNFLLISSYSYMGAAIATLLSQFILFLIVYTFTKKYYFVPYNWQLIIPLIFILAGIVFLNLVLLMATLLVFFIKIVVLLLIVVFIYIKKRHYIMSFLNNSST